MPRFCMDELKTLSKRKIKGEKRVFYFITDKNALLRKFQRLQSKTDLPLITLHDLRHSHASLMINLNCSVTLVSARLGHENISTTLKTYTHLFPTQEYDLIFAITKSLQK